MKRKEYRGLCSTCEGRADCTFPHHNGRPTLFCEEHDWWWQYRMEAAAIAKLLAPRPRPPEPVATEKPSQYKGLCRTCEHRETCTYPKPEGGVWHCDEFV